MQLILDGGGMLAITSALVNDSGDADEYFAH
jgi:hypothetical protein